jgi:hypothetical protein
MSQIVTITKTLCCFFIGVTLEKVLEEVYEDSDIQPLSKTVMLQPGQVDNIKQHRKKPSFHTR